MDSLETENAVHSIEAQAVKPIVTKPHQGIIDDEPAHPVAMRAIEIDCRTPHGLVLIGEVRSELPQMISIRPQMVINDVQQYGQTLCMTGIDEIGKLPRRAIGRKRCEHINAVISPATSTRKCRQGHQFKMRHAKLNQMRQLFPRRCVSAFGGECPDVELVQDGLLEALRAEPGTGALSLISRNPLGNVGRAVDPHGLPR